MVDAYEQTLFEVHCLGGRVVLSTDGIVEGNAAWLPVGPIALITAYNPGVTRPGPGRNNAANQQLEELLRARGYRFSTGSGFSRDRSHSEPSYAVESLTEDDARELGREFGQAAVFYWKDGVGTLLWCSQAES